MAFILHCYDCSKRTHSDADYNDECRYGVVWETIGCGRLRYNAYPLFEAMPTVSSVSV